MMPARSLEAEEGPVGMFAQLLNLVRAELTANGWITLGSQTDETAPWHLAVRKGVSWRVIQILAPASTPAQRQEGRRNLGVTVQLPGRMGKMEQWLAHVRPGGRIVFSVDHLSSTAWSISGSETAVSERLGIAGLSPDGVAVPASATAA